MTYPTIPQLLDRRGRALRRRRFMARLHEALSAAFFFACAGFALLMAVYVMTAGGAP